MNQPSPSVSIRIARLSAAAVPGQLRHDLRTGVIPDYVDRDRVAENRVLVEPPSPVRMRERTVERRARASPRRALRRDAAIAVAGIITWSREAQVLIRAAAPDRQDAAYRAIAEAVGRHYGIGVLGLTVHVDESAPHAHVWWDSRCEDGSALSASLNTAHLQDLAAGALGPLFPQIGRGRSKRERRAAGEPRSTWVNRSVRELHEDLPAEIAALEREWNLARDRVAEMAARVSALETRQAELGALTDRERRRLATYAGRLADRESKLATATERLDAVRTTARRIATEAEASAEAADQAERRRDQARREASETIAEARAEAERVREAAHTDADAVIRDTEQRYAASVEAINKARAAAAEQGQALRTMARNVVEEAEQRRDAALAEAETVTRAAETRSAALADATACAFEVITDELARPQPESGQWWQGARWDPERWRQVGQRLDIEWPARLWTRLRGLADRVTALANAAAELEDSRTQLRRQAERVQGWIGDIAGRLGLTTMDPAEVEATLAELGEEKERLPRPTPFDDGP